MERIYYVRERRITVEEVPDVVAIRIDPEEPRSVADFGSPGTETVIAAGVAYHEKLQTSATQTDPEASSAATNEIVRSTLTKSAEAFEAADWLFVEPSDETAARVRAGDDLPGAVGVGKVLIRFGPGIAIATKRLNVRLRESLSTSACRETLARHGLRVVGELRVSPNMFIVDSSRADALAVSVELHGDDDFVFAEPSLIEHISARFDPKYVLQWHWKNNGGQTWLTAGADVSAEDAWAITVGTGIRIAVIDLGFDAGHPDLAAGVSGASGYFTGSYPVVASFNHGTGGMPTNDHGTACAGIVGARRGNDEGGTGGAPECELVLIAIETICDQATLARAVKYAIDPATESEDSALAAEVVSCSLGPFRSSVWPLSATLDDALTSANDGRGGKGLPIFWAGVDLLDAPVADDEVVSHDNVVAVVSSDGNDQKSIGPSGAQVELTAPGQGIYTTMNHLDVPDPYGYFNGTSYAAPVAAACAALALAVNGQLTREKLREVLHDTADKIGGVVYDASGHNDSYGFGRVNAFAAVKKARAMGCARVLVWLMVLLLGGSVAIYTMT